MVAQNENAELIYGFHHTFLSINVRPVSCVVHSVRHVQYNQCLKLEYNISREDYCRNKNKQQSSEQVHRVVPNSVRVSVYGYSIVHRSNFTSNERFLKSISENVKNNTAKEWVAYEDNNLIQSGFDVRVFQCESTFFSCRLNSYE